ncbi:hypothetical protein FGE12_12480 [Aggregicoccus sp. 17bor-14]|uniref:hypothetical protein n=1 Tax=Myxococcaceae TaxID=31 RepID=UPI00129CD0F1|nr:MULTISPECIES: hypothetical protein [Myxococcaceae]MBF5043207.1 hypothetical protein [Simulacricoccus sp. 17bor-14]MRI88964.1 hypothetical protein [Aggregicoccus sp. 17bor-14]
MEREVQDADGVTWKCVQAFAGLSDKKAAKEAARTEEGRLQVVCTPSGGARSVRVELKEGWEKLPDERLLQAIRAAQAEQGDPEAASA